VFMRGRTIGLDHQRQIQPARQPQRREGVELETIQQNIGPPAGENPVFLPKILP